MKASKTSNKTDRVRSERSAMEEVFDLSPDEDAVRRLGNNGSALHSKSIERHKELRSLMKDWFESDAPGFDQISQEEFLSILRSRRLGRGQAIGDFLRAKISGEPIRLSLTLTKARIGFICMIVLIGIASYISQNWPQSSVGELNYASDGVKVDDDVFQSAAMDTGSMGFPAGSSIMTRKGDICSFSLGEKTLALQNESTSIRVISKEHLRIDHGSSWFFVEPGGEGFLVETPLVNAKVIGTKFGASVSEDAVTIQVTEGSVRVSHVKGPERLLSAGQTALIDRDGIVSIQDRPNGIELPEWVTSFLSADTEATIGEMLPSVGK